MKQSHRSSERDAAMASLGEWPPHVATNKQKETIKKEGAPTQTRSNSSGNGRYLREGLLAIGLWATRIFSRREQDL